MRRQNSLSARFLARHGLSLLLGCVLALALADVGCTPDTRRAGGDSGSRFPSDAGIILVDSGDDRPPPPPPARDSGIMLMDSGPPPPPFDAGPPPPPPGSCRLDSFTQLPVACLPRCSSATEAAVMACTDGTCLNAALDADTTPATTLTLPDGMTTSLDCGGCFGQQVQSCWFDFCPTEFQNWFTCNDGGGVCTTENDALEACRSASTVVSCENSRLSGCFP